MVIVNLIAVVWLSPKGRCGAQELRAASANPVWSLFSKHPICLRLNLAAWDGTDEVTTREVLG